MPQLGSIGRRADLPTNVLTGHPMSFDRLKRTQRSKRLPGHKLKPSRATLFVQNSKPHLSMKPTYFLGIDAAKHKMRATLSNRSEHVLFEKELSVEATGLRQLLAAIKRQVNDPEQLLVLIEATGLLHLNWSAALTKAGYAVAVINPLMARRLYTLQNSIRDNKSDPIDARGLCTIGLLHGEKLLAHYRFSLRPEQFTLQRAQSVRKALRSALGQPEEDLSESDGPKLPRAGWAAPVGRGRYPPVAHPGAHPRRHRGQAPLHFREGLDGAPKGGGSESSRR
jgi:hypothetical protein